MRTAFGVGLVLLAAAIALTLSHSPPRVVHANQQAHGHGIVLTLIEEGEVCQANETLPAGVSAIRAAVGAYFGSPVRVTVSSGSRILTQGRRGADWTGGAVTVPVKPLSQAVAHAKVCFDIGPVSELLYIQGEEAKSDPATLNGGRLSGRIGIEYLASGQGSWWSHAASVAKHMEFGRFVSGPWIAPLIALLMAGVAALSIWLTLRTRPSEEEPDGRLARTLRGVPTAAWVCALIAFLNAFAWSLIVPIFQGKDEVDQFAYVQTLAENHVLPDNGQQNGVYARQTTIVLGALHYFELTHSPQVRAISTPAEQKNLIEAVHAGQSLQTSGEAGIATTEPPLYYALQTIPYELARGNILIEMQLMRLVGALLGALTALLIFLFLREVIPDTPWPATVGALCAALQPMFASMNATVSPDTMLYTVSAAVFLCLARAFRRGLTPRGAAVLGVVLAVGFVTKLNFVAIGVGGFVGLAVLAVRDVRAKRWQALTSPAIAAAIGISPVILYALRNIATSRPTLGMLSGSGSLLTSEVPWDEFSYVWQMYLPRLPGMTHYFLGIHTYKDIWLDRSVGLYGWMDTVFPTWVDNLALIPVAIVTLLCGRELVVRRAALRARLPELGVYALLVLFVLAMIAIPSYRSDALGHGPAFGEPRYLVPLLPLVAAGVALAIRGAGRRWAPVVTAGMVLLFFGHDLFSQLETIARYYS